MADFKRLNSVLSIHPMTMFNLASGLASLFGLILVFKNPLPESDQGKVFAYFVISLVVILVLYIYYYNATKLHRYAQCGAYIHQANHIMRDYLAKLEEAFKTETANDSLIENEFKKTVVGCLDSISELFTLISGKKCSVSFKELKTNDELVTIARDSHSQTKRKKVDNGDYRHSLEENTDFFNLFFGLPGCENYFFSNDIVKLWKSGNYKNTSFKAIGQEPEYFQIGNKKIVTKWPLSYKSTIVFPIRYIADPFDPPSPESSIRSMAHWKYCGFLCIDSKSRKIFDERHQCDIGAAFADSLYLFITQFHSMYEAYTEPFYVEI